MKKSILLFLWIFVAAPSWAQQALTIEQCYELARQNYPLIHQKDLVAKSKEFSVANARTGFLPQVSIAGQATYQSEVTRVPLEVPGFKVDALSKDQYKIYAELNQSIYDGGTVKRQTALQETNALVEDQKVEVELYRIKERINQIYFGTLLIDEQKVQAELIKKDLTSSLAKMESAIRNGTAFKTNADILQAELLKTDQRIIELNATKRSYLDMLGLFIHQEIAENVVLQKPTTVAVSTDSNLARPELTLYRYQSELITAQQQLTNTKVLPRVSLFVQGGYGKPGLNMLLNKFDTYYIGGLRLNWNLGGFYNTKRDKQLLDVNLQSVNYQKEAFLFNTNLTLKQQNNDITKLNELIAVDEKLIELRTRIKNTAKAQLENGVITANDYLRELNAEDQAKQNLALHQTQLVMTQYNYQVTSGN
ncbi:MAG: TolC family protein [Bacteroidota bacterium]